MTFRTVTRSVPILAIFAMLPMALLASNDGGQGELEKEGAQLITQIEESARDIRFHAERLDSFTRNMQISKWAHVHHLEQIKAAVNGGLRPASDRLIEIQPLLPDWKQRSIDMMLEVPRPSPRAQ